jgi:hypothetical protein
MLKKKKIAFTITDGWAYRYYCITEINKFIQDKYDVFLICSPFYFELFKEMKLDGVSLLPIPKSNKYESLIISFINVVYRNSYDNPINEFYINKYNVWLRFFFKFFQKVLKKIHAKLIFVLKFCLEFEISIFSRTNFVLPVEVIYFLSPYTHDEVVLSILLKRRIQQFFVLPSWDNIYKYYLFDNYFKYFVWGSLQKEFLEKRIKGEIIVIGNISHFVMRRISSVYLDSIKTDKIIILYCTVTKRIFKNEIFFVQKLKSLIEANFFGKNVDMIIRPHPADLKANLYNNFVSDRISISGFKSNNVLNKWIVNKDFFKGLFIDFNYSTLVLNVASTITLDAISLGRFVINIKPIESKGDLDYYNFQHYLPITRSKLVPIICEQELERIRFFLDEIQFSKTQVLFSQNGAINQIASQDFIDDLDYYLSKLLN